MHMRYAVPAHDVTLSGERGRKSSVARSTPSALAASSSAGTCLNGITPPVPPASFGRFQLATRVR